MDKNQNVRMLISLATGSKETLTAWVNTKSQNTKRNQLTSKKQHQNQKRIHSKRKSETTATTSQRPVQISGTCIDNIKVQCP